MTDYLKKSFTVPASGKREDPCTHGWLDPRGRCVLCGETPSDEPTPMHSPLIEVGPGHFKSADGRVETYSTSRYYPWPTEGLPPRDSLNDDDLWNLYGEKR